MTVKVKLTNASGIPLVRFRGVHFDAAFQFAFDVPDGQTQQIDAVSNGDIGLTAYRVSDQRALGTLAYPVSDTQGFAAVVIHLEDDPGEVYRLVGEAFLFPAPQP